MCEKKVKQLNSSKHKTTFTVVQIKKIHRVQIGLGTYVSTTLANDANRTSK